MSTSGDISMSFFFAALAVLSIVVIFFLFRKSTDGLNKAEEKKERTLPQDTEEEYRIGMDPCSSGKPVMYTLQTCLHCVHLKHFLDKHGIECLLVYVDDFEGEQRRELMSKVRSFNPRGSFPTLVLPDGRVSVGFRETQVSKLLGID